MSFDGRGEAGRFSSHSAVGKDYWLAVPSCGFGWIFGVAHFEANAGKLLDGRRLLVWPDTCI
jgi:hypothetical protein